MQLLIFIKKRDTEMLEFVFDTVKINGNQIDLDIQLAEGNRYYFGDIKFLGNSVYSDEQLSRVLGLFEGDTYNGVLLKKRIRIIQNQMVKI